MRENKFRGIEKETGQFVYGGIAQEVLTASGFIADVAIMPPRCYGIEVDPETVGQYTGLKDCDGVEIYEGDITKDKDISQSLYDTGEYVYGVIEFIDCRYVDVYRYDGEEYHEEIHNVVVIGNIHQNPELIK